jgi:predicted nucleotidyltransferase
MVDDAATTQDGRTEVRVLLRAAGARFAFVHGSRAHDRPRPDSDLDVAAWFDGVLDEDDLRSRLPADVDLLVLDDAPLELAGRVAQHGVLLFDDDPPARVAWQAMTRKIFLDERPRVEAARRDFAAARRARAATRDAG